MAIAARNPSGQILLQTAQMLCFTQTLYKARAGPESRRGVDYRP